MVHEGIGPKDVFVPEEEPALYRRWAYYVRLAEDPPSLVEACSAEATLLAEHPFFSKEMHLPRLTGFFAGRQRPDTDPGP